MSRPGFLLFLAFLFSCSNEPREQVGSATFDNPYRMKWVEERFDAEGVEYVRKGNEVWYKFKDHSKIDAIMVRMKREAPIHIEVGNTQEGRKYIECLRASGLILGTDESKSPTRAFLRQEDVRLATRLFHRLMDVGFSESIDCKSFEESPNPPLRDGRQPE